MPLPTLDLTGAKGAGRRKLDAVPGAFRRAFDSASGEDAKGRAGAAEVVRLAVSGEEGAFTTAGARVLGAAIDALLAGDVAAPEHLSELALDLAYGDLPVALVPVTATTPAAKLVCAEVTTRLDALRRGLRARLPEARGLAAWLLLSAGAVDDAVSDALADEQDPGARAALSCALAGHRGVDRAILRAAMGGEPAIQAAGAAAWWALDGDDAPDAVPLVLLLARHDERPGTGFPWRSGPGRLGFRALVASDTRGRAIAADWVIRELAGTLDDLPAERATAGRAFGEVRQLLAALLPQPPDPATLSPLARRVVALTTARWFLGRRDFAELGLPETVAGRRAWLGERDDTDVVDRWADGLDGRTEGDLPSEDDARDALAARPAAEREAWARAWLQRRRPRPGATRAPNGRATLLALEQLDSKALDLVWCRDHEPVLAALTVDDPRAVAMFARIPPGRRPSVWRAWTALHPNPAVAFREGLRTAPSCPLPEVAVGLLGLAADAGREPLDGLADALDAMGDAGRVARERLAAIAEAANRTEGAVSRDRREGE